MGYCGVAGVVARVIDICVLYFLCLCFMRMFMVLFY